MKCRTAILRKFSRMTKKVDSVDETGPSVVRNARLHVHAGIIDTDRPTNTAIRRPQLDHAVKSTRFCLTFIQETNFLKELRKSSKMVLCLAGSQLVGTRKYTSSSYLATCKVYETFSVRDCCYLEMSIYWMTTVSIVATSDLLLICQQIPANMCQIIRGM